MYIYNLVFPGHTIVKMEYKIHNAIPVFKETLSDYPANGRLVIPIFKQFLINRCYFFFSS